VRGVGFNQTQHFQLLDLQPRRVGLLVVLVLVDFVVALINQFDVVVHDLVDEAGEVAAGLN